MLSHNVQGGERLGVGRDGDDPVKKASGIPESAKVPTYNDQVFVEVKYKSYGMFKMLLCAIQSFL